MKYHLCDADSSRHIKKLKWNIKMFKDMQRAQRKIIGEIMSACIIWRLTSPTRNHYAFGKDQEIKKVDQNI